MPRTGEKSVKVRKEQIGGRSSEGEKSSDGEGRVSERGAEWKVRVRA